MVRAEADRPRQGVADSLAGLQPNRENLWAILKRKMGREAQFYKNTKENKQKISLLPEKAKRVLHLDMFSKLSKSFLARLRGCVERNGGYTGHKNAVRKKNRDLEAKK